LMDKLKAVNPVSYVSCCLKYYSIQETRQKLGPHIRGIEPEWYQKAA